MNEEEAIAYYVEKLKQVFIEAAPADSVAASVFEPVQGEGGFIPAPNHAGGLSYHGMSSVLSQLYDDGLMEARSAEQTAVFKAAEQFARIEGILPAPESSHAIKVAMDEALKCKETGEEKTILFGLTGTGYFDLVAYERFNNGQMSDYIPNDEDLKKGFDGIPQFPGNEIK